MKVRQQEAIEEVERRKAADVEAIESLHAQAVEALKRVHLDEIQSIRGRASEAESIGQLTNMLKNTSGKLTSQLSMQSTCSCLWFAMQVPFD